ncbi:MAG: hypothetical protein N0E55_06700 [Candidatus Thiodiazotropha taylori]|nr:hypothetical protein [Candidatus Thiodiazotropha taylori]MCW4252380.1 hypothetical protein [Candidatus Thiodiazotropha taylori]
MLRLSSINPVAAFVLKVVFWLPVCLAGWYYLAPSLVWPVGLLSDWILTALFPQIFQGVEQQGDRLDFVTLLAMPAELLRGQQPGVSGDLVFTVNPLLYSYGLPLYTALSIATPGDAKDEDLKWNKWLWGLPLLFLFQVWGVRFDGLKTLLFTLGPEISSQLAFSPIAMDGVALGYQLGYLILPSVLPLVIWVVQYRAYLTEMVWAPE